MGIDVGNLVSGFKTAAGDVVHEGEDLEKKLVETAKKMAAKALDKAVPKAGQIVENIGNHIPTKVVNAALGGAEKAIGAGAFIVEHTPGMPQKVKNLASDLSKVDLKDFTDNTLPDGKKAKGDWGALACDWFFEMKPQSLGKWDTVTIDGQKFNQCTFTDLSYASDLSQLQTQQAAKNLLFQNGTSQVGAQVNMQWQYTGQGTEKGGIPFTVQDPKAGQHYYVAQGGLYGTIESFLGSYDTTAKVVSVGSNGNVTIQYTVTNNSDWEVRHPCEPVWKERRLAALPRFK